ncbi:uncharacterized protein TRAVEDRAFT_46706 [Trametes versicolor FP-101664 SS1]|uniref:uncharacterized protein n=1 Tax=Trametes versicolor (strain FP-101664) TaxID=717944 RepID=UPI0004623C8A|nr:uncharacterized protein TRAVEDRAFT_46706 [Trametes versicolor FP-101664 SS1]EIW59397.1 hypothetical protein TRAVEDRAFT_46706 [Trametes versicolor FP-101664 SS1]
MSLPAFQARSDMLTVPSRILLKLGSTRVHSCRSDFVKDAPPRHIPCMEDDAGFQLHEGAAVLRILTNGIARICIDVFNRSPQLPPPNTASPAMRSGSLTEPLSRHRDRANGPSHWTHLSQAARLPENPAAARWPRQSPSAMRNPPTPARVPQCVQHPSPGRSRWVRIPIALRCANMTPPSSAVPSSHRIPSPVDGVYVAWRAGGPDDPVYLVYITLSLYWSLLCPRFT